MVTNGEITGLLIAARGGDEAAANRLAGLVYGELRLLAHHCRRDRGAAGTLSTTALVHETYLRMGGLPEADFADRAHFFAYAAQAMRRILVDHARRSCAAKRGGNAPHVIFDDVALSLTVAPEQVVALDQVLTRLHQLDERLASLVELRVFAGLDVSELAQALELSERTVKRDWRKARALLGGWLQETLLQASS
ncbi:MAG TPA: ECF-type sigma factor [Dokdonella sp.]|uniref:ECF-type sigma factor n=1 Tax=Dokdonella sp. TaxID=2291710 RepID=UPI002D7E5B3D|nr:ECF-type sigma factor [Dokdonella sp.]HET9033379.1 ECF-type sigma factor [Dokdonella sp.]